MNRPTRREFLKYAGIGYASIGAAALSPRPSMGEDRKNDEDDASAPNRPASCPPPRTLYSNDTTNITSCVSPYHQKHDPFSDDCLRGTIDEAQGVDVHMLQPGLGWIPWWKSDIYDGAEHYLAYERDYGIKPNAYGRYLAAGGDVVRTFVEHCRKVGTAPYISYRLNDAHHLDSIDTKSHRASVVSKFYRENYRRHRLGPDMKSWSDRVLNWAVPEIREHKFAFIREICEKYDIDGLELDFMRHWSFFRLDETTSDQRRDIMARFVGRVREVLDRTERDGRRRWLCVRVPALLPTHDSMGVDLPRFTAAGVDMINLSSSFFTVQATDLPQIHAMLPGTPLYLEMTHTPLTGPALAGSGSSVYQRTTDHQFYTTAHLAYCQGATGVSLFNFVYYREHVMPELGPFCEPPFHVLPRLRDPDWLARQSQWYFLTGTWNKPPAPRRPLPVVVKPGDTHRFSMEMAPTEHQTQDGLFRLMTREEAPGSAWQASINGVSLDPTAFVRKPIDHPHEGYLGTPEQYACFTCSRSVVKSGTNDVKLTYTKGRPVKLIYLDLVLP